MAPLYHEHSTYGLRTQMLGHRPVVGFRLTMKGSRANYIVQVGPVCMSWGPAGGVEEGRASVPDNLLRWGHCWWSRSGAWAFAIDWTRDA